MTRLDERARQFLERQRLAHLATADAAGVPHVVPICFALVGETVYVAIDEKPKTTNLGQLRRLRNIIANPRVAIVADVYDDVDWSRLGFVLLSAHARVVTEGAEHVAAVSALRGRYQQYDAMALEARPVIAADVDHVTAWGHLGD
jgi:PPOX class probable F420-dependent enzyme